MNEKFTTNKSNEEVLKEILNRLDEEIKELESKESYGDKRVENNLRTKRKDRDMIINRLNELSNE